MANQYSGDQHVITIPRIDLNPKLIVAVVCAVILAAGLLTCFYRVDTEEVAVVTRFGEFKKTAESGLRFKLPFFIDQVTKVPVKRELTQEFGHGSAGASDEAQFMSAGEQELEKSMVTGDLNAALVEWVIQYRIEDPRKYLFEVRDPKLTLRDVSESVMREVVGDRTVDEVITVGRQGIEVEAEEKLQKKLEEYNMGLVINQVQLIDVNPPEMVQSSFNEVNRAQQDREKAINVANGEYNREVPHARGEAERKIQEAEGYALQRVNEAEGDAAKFNALFEEYQKAPEVTRQRLYLETVGEVLPNLDRKVILDEDAKQILPLLQMNETRPAQ